MTRVVYVALLFFHHLATRRPVSARTSSRLSLSPDHPSDPLTGSPAIPPASGERVHVRGTQ